MKRKQVNGLIYLIGLCILSGCGEKNASNEMAADYEVERIMSEEKLAAAEWKETFAPYMEYDWLEDEHIEWYLDTVWTMQLADLNLDGQEEMLVTLPIYNGESQTYIYTVEAGAVVYCGQIVAGAAYKDNEAFMSAEGYLPSGYIDVYQNKSGEFRYLSGNTFLKGDHGYYQIYESEFVENHISCKPLYGINFFQDTEGQMIYQYAEGDWQEREGELTDDQNFTEFAQVMDTYMEGWEKADITFLISEFQVPDFVDELSEEKKEIIRDNILAGFASLSADLEDEEAALEEAILVLENHLPDLEGIDEVLPGRFHVGDVCQGDIGNDGRQDIAILLESWDVFPSEEDVDYTCKSHRAVCIFTEKEPDVYEYVCKNEKLVRDSNNGGVWGDPYAGIKIQDGFLTISDYGGSNDRWGDDFTFGIGESGALELYKIRRYSYNIHYGFGQVDYFDYTTCITESYVVEDCNIEEPTFSSSTDFIPRNSIPVLFEDTRETQDWMR